jgi:ArsR family transcriptional regulator
MKKTAQTFKALADETRLRILALLAEGELCVCDLMAILDMPQSTVSRHLAYLRNAGWVEDRRQGVWMYYRLADANGPFFSDILGLLEKHLPGQARAVEDRRALKNFQLRKTPETCG